MKTFDRLMLEGYKFVRYPEMPQKWNFEVGWTKYDSLTNTFYKIEFPDADLLFFDIELVVRDGKLPTLAVALSKDNWYSWCSDRLIYDNPVPVFPKLEHLIPLESQIGLSTDKLIIGHNVAFDRTRVREQYYKTPSRMRFWDTMSMAIPIHGISDKQVYALEKKDYEAKHRAENPWLPHWRGNVSKNNLLDLYRLKVPDTYPWKIELNKESRDVFVKEDIQTVRADFQNLVQYCAYDVMATHQLYRHLYEEFMHYHPSSVTRFGMLEMMNVYLPINHNWKMFASSCADKLEKDIEIAATMVINFSKQILNQLLNDYKDDPWMFISEWKAQSKTNKFPRWYSGIFKNAKAAQVEIENDTVQKVKTGTSELARIFGVCFGPYPLYHKKEFGWGFLVPSQELLAMSDYKNVGPSGLTRRNSIVSIPTQKIMELINKNIEMGKSVEDIKTEKTCSIGYFEFHKVPHSTSPGSNVGNVFSKVCTHLFEQGTLWTSRGVEASAKMLEVSRSARYWTNYKKRFNDELPIWYDDDAEFGALAPSVVPSGTVTRRSTHKLWLTASSSKDGVVGTDLKSMIQAHQGYKIVGADVDSQEQWLAAIMGDAIRNNKGVGDSEFSYLLLMGDKSKGTDLHSVVAKEVGMNRNQAKTLNYARLYGAGTNNAINHLKNEGIPEEEARALAKKMYEKTKGITAYYRKLQNTKLNNLFKKYLFQTYYLKKAESLYLEFDGIIYVKVLDNVTLSVDGRVPTIEDFYKYVHRQLLSEVKNPSMEEQHQINKKMSHLRSESFEYPAVELYRHGIESDTFNYLNLMQLEDELRTPVLSCKLGYALHPMKYPIIGAIPL
uniref:DNA-directed DNA polymerase n=1 Tax=Rhabditophanes sp. KR3021 TaxID=114890 RepID=A0AC35U1L5_9BILA